MTLVAVLLNLGVRIPIADTFVLIQLITFSLNSLLNDNVLPSEALEQPSELMLYT